MTQLEDIADWLKTSVTEVGNFRRDNPSDHTKAGWGQFLSNNVHGNQIGPYGTCAAIYLHHIADPASTISDAVVAQIESFWAEGQGSKLYEQNIRLAFLVFSLSLAHEPRLLAVRQSAIALLKSRQLQNGGWADAVSRSNQDVEVSRLDVTAWVSLALHQVSGQDNSAIRGADHILQTTTGAFRASNLSPICVAAILNVIEPSKVNSHIRARAYAIVARPYTDSDYQISFFDYYRGAQAAKLSRDYLCSPSLLAASFVLKGLSEKKSFFGSLRLSAAKSQMIERLSLITKQGVLFKVPEAKFATTVDQALIGMIYLNLREITLKSEWLNSRILSFKAWLSESYFLSVIIPILILVTAMATFQAPSIVPDLMEKITGLQYPAFQQWFKSWASLLQWFSALIVLLFTQLPRVFVDATKKRLLR